MKQKDKSIPLAYRATEHVIEETKASAQHVTMNLLLSKLHGYTFWHLAAHKLSAEVGERKLIRLHAASDSRHNKVNTMHDCKKVSYAYRMLI